MKRPKTVMIDIELFLDLSTYLAEHSEPSDEKYQRIRSGIRQKIEAMIRHELYSLYKTGASPDVRRKARAEYLDAIGLHADFRWDDSHDVNINS